MHRQMRQIFVFAVILVIPLAQSCIQPDPDKPGIEYAPNMYHPTSFHPLKDYDRERNEVNPHGMNMRMPPEGTVARGKKDYAYPYPDSQEGFEQAGEELVNPLPKDEEILAEGERLYNIYCQSCHGEKGLGDGPVASKEPGDQYMPGIPRFNSGAVADRTEGNIYHVITYGRNLMGSHSSQLTPEQRWKVTHYVKKLQRYDENADEFLPEEEDVEENDNEDDDNNEGEELSEVTKTE